LDVDYHEWDPEATPPPQHARPPDDPRWGRGAVFDARMPGHRAALANPAGRARSTAASVPHHRHSVDLDDVANSLSVTAVPDYRDDTDRQTSHHRANEAPPGYSIVPVRPDYDRPPDRRIPHPREPIDQPFDGFAIRGGEWPRPETPATALVPATSTAVVPAPPPRHTTPDDERDYAVVMWWTAIWFALPAVIYTIWTFTRSTTPQPGCASVTGGACASPRTAAIDAITHHAAAIVITLLLSAAVAAAMHRFTLAWRAITVGLAAAIISAGAVTLAVSAIN
jgi:hypothetical protein